MPLVPVQSSQEIEEKIQKKFVFLFIPVQKPPFWAEKFFGCIWYKLQKKTKVAPGTKYGVFRIS
jgi:hypothetical protein